MDRAARKSSGLGIDIPMALASGLDTVRVGDWAPNLPSYANPGCTNIGGDPSSLEGVHVESFGPALHAPNTTPIPTTDQAREQLQEDDEPYQSETTTESGFHRDYLCLICRSRSRGRHRS